MEPTDSDQPRYQLRNRTTTVSTSSSQVTTMSHANLPAIDGHMAEGRSEEEATDASQTDNIAHPQCAATQPTISMPAADAHTTPQTNRPTRPNPKITLTPLKTPPITQFTSLRSIRRIRQKLFFFVWPVNFCYLGLLT